MVFRYNTTVPPQGEVLMLKDQCPLRDLISENACAPVFTACAAFEADCVAFST
jgi:hypothetical protein